ncbi:MAG: NAD(P)-dependent oxidoreductase [Solirubrobacteraceae bacterium]|nr:NAD(P)-dependent oxidoreductase [Solirubrobacteraceae bacterium]
MGTPPDWLAGAGGRTLVVLGADGFIGSWVVRLALHAGAHVVGLCVKQPWRLADLPGERLALEAVPGGRWWEPAQLDVLARVLPGATALVHLGYEPPPAGADRGAHERAVNVAAAGRVARVAAAAGARIVFASSADVYGPWHDDPVDESVPARPATPYAEAKLAAESLVLAAPDACCLRIATVFGPGELGPRAIPAFVRALADARPATLHGDGADVRDYVGVAEVAAAIVNATDERVDPPPLLNLGSGVGRSTRAILETVAGALGAEPAASSVESGRAPSRLVVDAGAARRLLGFAADPGFADAVAREARWMLGERDRWPA